MLPILKLVLFASCLYHRVAAIALSNPCVDNSYIDHALLRATNCAARDRLNDNLKDRDLTTGWYRAAGLNGKPLQMPTKCVERNKCGTMLPIWLNGSHPTFAEGIVTRSACQLGLPNDCCINTYPVMVKNCSTFYVYHLSYTEGGAQAYCFGPDEDCPPHDPCYEWDHKVISEDSSRVPDCKGNTDTKCDDNLIEGWYKFDGQSGPLNMPVKPVDKDSCGTEKPIWMNGKIPLASEGIVNRTACVSTDTYCNSTYNIQVKSCPEFVAYKLKPTSRCPERYCVGEQPKTKCPGNHGTTNRLGQAVLPASTMVLVLIMHL